MGHEYEVARNPCTLCTPLGAVLAFAGVKGGMTLLHGSQGCATYVRRYLISHFREPVDVASSSFTEETAVFGGARNLNQALDNVTRKYRPSLVGVATTCLAETIGEDAAAILRARSRDARDPVLVSVSTPSYRGTHREGYRDALRAVVEALNPASAGPRRARGGEGEAVNLIPAMVSTADQRWLKETMEAFGLRSVLLPDSSETLDGPPWERHRLLPEGGTPVETIASMAASRATVELGAWAPGERTAGEWLENTHGVKRFLLQLPVGIEATDRFTDALARLHGGRVPEKYRGQRGRLADAYADAHKYVRGTRVLLYGELDLTAALEAFVKEIGMIPVLAPQGSRDFNAVDRAADESGADLVLGNGKGYASAVRLGAPLVRVGFPIHDRFGGQRTRILGYDGTLELLDRIVNALIEARQEENDVGYTYY